MSDVLAVTVRYGASLHIGKGLDLSVFMLGYANPRFASALYAVLMPFVAAVAVVPETNVVRYVSLRSYSLCIIVDHQPRSGHARRLVCLRTCCAGADC